LLVLWPHFVAGAPSRGYVSGDQAGAIAADVASVVPLHATERRLEPAMTAALGHLFKGNVPPVVPVAVPDATPRRCHAFGARLAALASRGIMVVAFGATVHQGEGAEGRRTDAKPPAFATEFDAWCANLLSDGESGELFAFGSRGPMAAQAHDAEGTYLRPLFVAMGAASLAERAVGFPLRGFEHGTISRRCVQFGRNT
jgi:4,5-DOPA dioxygenase extradiol